MLADLIEKVGGYLETMNRKHLDNRIHWLLFGGEGEVAGVNRSGPGEEGMGCNVIVLLSTQG